MADRIYELRIEVVCSDNLDEGTYNCLSSIALGAMESADLFVTGFSIRQAGNERSTASDLPSSTGTKGDSW